MISSQANPDMPPLMSPESQSPSPFRVGLANLNESMSGPRGKIAMAMMQQSLGSLGKRFNPGQMTQRHATQQDIYGNPIG